jgi:hypothetical protein
MSTATPLRGRCHCGATAFEVSHPPKSVTRCTCTFCAKRGGLWAYYDPQDFKLLSDRNRVAYSTHPEIHKHFFCGTCGCGTFSDTPVWENFQMVPGKRKVSGNARLFDDFDLEAVSVEVIDGKNLW